MRFRPCIDIHNGSVKQIVGGSLRDEGDQAADNFVSQQDGAYYGGLYRKDGLKGGHIILLNKAGSRYYQQDLYQARLALEAFPGGLQLGGGVCLENAEQFLDMGASHVIVTSYVFRDGIVDYSRLEQLSSLVGKEHLVLDLSCRRKKDGYYIVTDRWQKVTCEKLGSEMLEQLAGYCDEFLLHAVDMEGKCAGIEEEVVEILARGSSLPATYAGGIHSMEDVEIIRKLGKGQVDFTVGSGLDLFGGTISYQALATLTKNN